MLLPIHFKQFSNTKSSFFAPITTETAKHRPSIAAWAGTMLGGIALAVALVSPQSAQQAWALENEGADANAPVSTEVEQPSSTEKPPATETDDTLQTNGETAARNDVTDDSTSNDDAVDRSEPAATDAAAAANAATPADGEQSEPSDQSDPAGEPSAADQPSNAPVLPEEGDYVIRLASTNRMVLDVNGASPDNGANVQLYTYNATDAQKWHIAESEPGSGLFTIANLISGKLLDIAGAQTADGTNVLVWEANGGKNQLWRFELAESGWRILSALKPNFALDICGCGTSNGTNAHAWTMNSSAAQFFSLIALNQNNAPSTAEVATGAYLIQTSSNKAVDVSGASQDAGENVLQWEQNSGFNQVFYFEAGSDGFYRVFNVGSGLALDVEHADLLPGANIIQWTYHGGDGQLWALHQTASGAYTLISKLNGLALDIANGSSDNGANVQMYTPNGSKAQAFKLVALPLLPFGTYSFRSAADVNYAIDMESCSTEDGKAFELYAYNKSQAQKVVVGSQNAEAGDALSFRMVCSGLYLAASEGKAVQTSGKPAAPSNDDNESDDSIAANADTSITLGYSTVGARRGIVIIFGNGEVLTATALQNCSKLLANALVGNEMQAFLPVKTTLIETGIYTLESAVGNKVLDVYGGQRTNLANIEIYTPNGTNGQKFLVTSIGDERYIVQNASSMRAIDVTNASKESGANVALWQLNWGNPQVWSVELLDGGYFHFINAIAGMALTVEGSQDEDCANVCVAVLDDELGQRWRPVATTLAWEDVILNVPSIFQYPELPTGCESVALTNAILYYGFNLSKTEIADRYMPWSNWDFVYSFYGNPHQSGGNAIMAPGITNTANNYLRAQGSSLRASNITGTSFYDLFSYLNQGTPVVIWSTMYFADPGYAYGWQDGYTLRHNTHAITLAGYTADWKWVLVSDPLSGSVWRDASRMNWIYNVMGQQAVVIQ